MDTLFQVQERHNIVEYFSDGRYDSVLMTALFGSQNYKLDNENSDIDTVSIVLPTYKNFICGDQPVSQETMQKDGSHIVLKDIRLAFNNLRKSNPNSIEWLISSYQVYNQEFNDILLHYLHDADRLFYMAHSNYTSMMNAIAGMTKSLKRENMSLGKRFAHYVRLTTLLDKYIDYGHDPRDYFVMTQEHLTLARNAKFGNITITEEDCDKMEKVILDIVNSFEKTKVQEDIEHKGQLMIYDFQSAIFDHYFEDIYNVE